MHVAELAALKKVATTDAVGDVTGIWVVGDGLEFGGDFGSEALVGIDVEDPGISEYNISQSPVLMRCPVIERAFDNTHTTGRSYLLGAIGTAGVVDDDVI